MKGENKMAISTPHVNLKEGYSFAKTVLMPGDPLRAKMIAETFLQITCLDSHQNYPARFYIPWNKCFAFFFLPDESSHLVQK